MIKLSPPFIEPIKIELFPMGLSTTPPEVYKKRRKELVIKGYVGQWFWFEGIWPQRCSELSKKIPGRFKQWLHYHLLGELWDGSLLEDYAKDCEEEN